MLNKGYWFLVGFAMLSLISCTTAKSSNHIKENQFIGRIYQMDGIPGSFFQFVSKDSAKYYSINEIGSPTIHKSNALWYMINDSTIELKVFYGLGIDTAKFILTYNSKKDNWIDNDGLTVFWRKKDIKLKGFILKEF